MRVPFRKPNPDDDLDDIRSGRAVPVTPGMKLPKGHDDEAAQAEKAGMLLAAVDASSLPNAEVSVTPIFDPMRPCRYAVARADGRRYDVILGDPEAPGTAEFLQQGLARELLDEGGI